MSAERSLFDAYREWRRLARACEKAIYQRNWPFLLECQSAIGKLQPLIATFTRQARDEWKRPQVDHVTKENQLRATILDLMALVESNKKLLQTTRAAALVEREQLERAGRTLKRIQSSYGSMQRPALRAVA